MMRTLARSTAALVAALSAATCVPPSYFSARPPPRYGAPPTPLPPPVAGAAVAWEDRVARYALSLRSTEASSDALRALRALPAVARCLAGGAQAVGGRVGGRAGRPRRPVPGGGHAP